MSFSIHPIPGCLANWINPIAADLALKSALMLAVSWLAILFCRRASSATRHFIWALAVCATLLLPLLSAMLPQWRILPAWISAELAPINITAPVVPRTATASPAPATALMPREASPNPTRAAAPQSQVTTSPIPISLTPPAPAPATTIPLASSTSGWATWIPIVWMSGSILLLLPIAISWIALWRIGRRLPRITAPSWVRLMQTLSNEMNLRRPVLLLRGRSQAMPMTWGLWQPKLLLPPEADDWSPQRQRVVIMHELAHIQRCDFVVQLIVQLARASYWVNPLMWLAARRIAIESEAACDDRVLASQTRPSDYAEHLLAVASGLTEGARYSAAAVAMARPSRLESRLLDILDGQRNRKSLTLLRMSILSLLLAAIIIPVAALRAGNRPITPAAPSSSPSLATQPAATRPALVFGPEQAGLRAALEIVSGDNPARLGQPLGVRFHVRNASTISINLSGGNTRQDAADRVIIQDSRGQRIPVKHIWYSGWNALQTEELAPGKAAIFKSTSIAFLPEGYDQTKVTTPIGNYVLVPPGRYTIQYQLNFPDVGVALGAWEGILETAPVTVDVEAPAEAPPAKAEQPDEPKPDAAEMQIIKVKLEAARRELDLAEKSFTAGLTTLLERQGAQSKVRILEAELQGNPIKVAEAKLIGARERLQMIETIHKAGMITDLELEKTRSSVAIAEAELRAVTVAAPAQPAPDYSDVAKFKGEWKIESLAGEETYMWRKRAVGESFDIARVGLMLPGSLSKMHGHYVISPLKPVKEFDVTFWLENLHVSQKGIYKLEGDTLTLCVGAYQGARPTQFVGVAEKSTLMVLKRIGQPKARSQPIKLKGHVVDDATGQPISNFSIQGGRVDDKDPTKITWGHSLETRGSNPKGELSTSVDWFSDWRCRIIASGYVPQPILAEAPAETAAEITDLVIRLKRGRQITGHVLDHTGKPVKDAGVYVIGPAPLNLTSGKAMELAGGFVEDTKAPRISTDASGAFTIARSSACSRHCESPQCNSAAPS